MSAMGFVDGEIKGVIARRLKNHADARGWLVELFREDEVPPEAVPVMAYVSLTKPGVTRGPHEHRDQTDNFVFFGPSTFRIYLWDNRRASPTYGRRQVLEGGEDSPLNVIVPPGVVHAYRNVGGKDGLVFNGANQLYAGRERKEPVDEIRHEDVAGSPFVID